MSQSESLSSPSLAQPLLHLVRRFGLQPTGLPRPAAQEAHAVRVRQVEEVMLGRLADRRRTRHGRVRILEIGRRVGRAAHFAGVAVLVLRAALGALALDVAVRQEHLLHRIVELLHLAPDDQSLRVEGAVDVFAEALILARIGRVVVVEVDVKAVEVALVLVPDAFDQRFRRDAVLFGAQHDRRAVGVVGTDVVDLVPQHLLEAHPDVGLDVLHQVPQVDGAIGVGQGGGDEEAADHERGRNLTD